jgi:hypothetical protein
MWDRVSDQLIGADFSQNGYFAHATGADTALTTPDRDTAKKYDRLIITPSNRVVIHGGVDLYPAPAASFEVGMVDSTGTISGLQTAVFSDGFSGLCQLVGGSATEFMCYDGSVIRQYTTTAGSAVLSLSKTINPAAGSPQISNSWGGTFAFDGLSYYLPNGNSLQYSVYQLDGSLQGTHQ